MTMAAVVLVCGLAAYLYADLLFVPLTVLGFGAACLVLLLSLFEIAAVTFLGSTLVRSSIPAAGIGIAALVSQASFPLCPTSVTSLRSA